MLDKIAFSKLNVLFIVDLKLAGSNRERLKQTIENRR